MTVERNEEFEPWPGEVDLIRMAALPLIEHIFAVTADGSVERSKGNGRGSCGYRADSRCVVASADDQLKGKHEHDDDQTTERQAGDFNDRS